MLTGFACEAVDAQASARLAVIARELAVAREALEELVVQARQVAAGVDWQASASAGFFDEAEEWAGAVSSLQCPLEAAIALTWQAHARAAHPLGACG